MGFVIKVILALVVGTIVGFLTQNHLLGLGGMIAVMAIRRRTST
ncbi:MAG: hypothetical protein BWX84_00255 [Verrucomicrobia bacterium ADurb.Bin118]|jgi:hypothetical protein|nr:MAG: hypothetical protein BWX84_00255 [Verrucomicrobia bacterium ADurb.Bin118]